VPVATPAGGAAVPVGPSGIRRVGPEQMYDSRISVRGADNGSAPRPFESSCGCSQPTSGAPEPSTYRGVVWGENTDRPPRCPTVVKTYPTSPRAASALYKLGFLPSSGDKRRRARTRAVSSPATPSPEANLARQAHAWAVASPASEGRAGRGPACRRL